MESVEIKKLEGAIEAILFTMGDSVELGKIAAAVEETAFASVQTAAGETASASLKKAGHTVLGKNRSRESIDYAFEHAMIDGEADGYGEA